MASKYISSFDLSLVVSEQNQSYQIFAYSDCLERKSTARLPSSIVKPLVPQSEQLQQGPLSIKDLQSFGTHLFEALIRDGVRDMYRILEGMNVNGVNFQLGLDLQSHLLQRLPWECMYDPYRETFVSLRDNFHIIRQVEQKQAAAAGKSDQGYSNLVIAIADAHGQPPINPQRERDLIETAVGDLHQQGLLNRRYIQGSQDEMRQALAQVPDVFHFVGHGGLNPSDIPGLYLEDAGGDAVFVPVSELENEYFTPPPEVGRHVGLVILSACQTSETPKTEGYNSLAYQLISQVDTILAMQYPIGLDNLTEFNSALYHALANGVPLESAVNTARRRIISDKPGGARDWIAPVLVKCHTAPSKLISLVSQNPFKGPIHYDLSDRERFFGRETELLRLGELYQKQNAVVIRGEGGSGKTSLLKAGWLPKLIGAQQPHLYLSLSENFAAQLRLEINKLLTQADRAPLPEGDLDQLTAHFPGDLAIILDRVEQVELQGEGIERILAALIHWAVDPSPEHHRSRLILATRLNEHGHEPSLLQQLLPEHASPRLDLQMLEYDQAISSIEATTRKSEIVFLPETIRAILQGLKYSQPQERSMTALQVVCRALYQHALGLKRDQVTPELLKDLNNVDGILDQEFKIASKLAQSIYTGGDSARKILAQFVGSDKQSMRPRSWQELQLRCGMEEKQLSQILDILQEDGLLRLEQQPGEEKFELVHETLIRQMDWLSDADIKLRELEEIVESAHTLIPLMSERGGLKDLDARRDELTLSGKQQELLLRSALEAGHETDYWFQRLLDPASAVTVLTSPYLSTHAQEHACRYLGVMGAREGEHSEKAKERLLQLAVSSESPSISRAASLALAPLADEAFITQHFGPGRDGLKSGEVSALAVMFDSHGLPVSALSKAALRQIRLKILKDNSVELLFSVLRAAVLGAAGFGLAAAWNFAQSYFASQTRGLPVFTFLILQLSLVGLLTFIIAFPGALLAPLGRDLSALFSGGRQKLPAALGTIAGSALGTGLTVAFLSGLAEYSNPSSLRLIRYFASGAILGLAIALPWLLTVRFTLKPVWLILLPALFGALVFTGISQLENWWPATSFALSIKGQHISGSDALAGFLIGAGSALGLAWGRLRDRPH